MKLFKKYFVLVFLLFSSSKAQISSQSMKGLYDNMPEAYRFLSPLHGMICAKSGLLDYWYRFFKKIPKPLLSDPFFKVVNLLFHSPLQLIKASDSMRDTLDQETIAAIIMRLPTFDEIKSIEKQFTEELTKQETPAIFTLTLLGHQLNNIPKNKLGGLQKIYLELSASIKASIKKRIKEIQNTGISSTLEEAINFLVDVAIDSCRGNYFPYAAHTLLLTFLYMRLERKSEFKRYFQSLKIECDSIMQAQNGNRCPVETFCNNMEEILQQEYSSDELLNIQKTIETKSSGSSKSFHTYLLEHLEQVHTLFYYIREKKTPLVPGLVMLEFGNETNPQGFTDCGEASIRNILNIGLFNPIKMTFDIEHLKRILLSHKYKNQPELVSTDPLVQFYTKYNTITQTYIPESRKEWAPLVSGIANVDYQVSDMPAFSTQGRPIACAMKGKLGIINVIRVLEYILFGEQFEQNHALQDRIDRICITLSSDFKKITAHFESKDNKHGHLIIAVDDVPTYDLVIEKEHFELVPIKQNVDAPLFFSMTKALLEYVDENNNNQTLQLFSWIPFPENTREYINTLYQTIQLGTLKTQTKKDDFCNEWLFTIDLASNSATQRLILDTYKKLYEPISFYLNAFNPSPKFIEELVEKGHMKQLKHILQTHSSNTSLSYIALNSISLKLLKLTTDTSGNQIKHLSWGNWGSDWEKNVTPLDFESLKGLAILFDKIELQLKRITLKNKNIQELSNNIKRIQETLKKVFAYKLSSGQASETERAFDL